MLTEVEARTKGAALMQRLKGTGWVLSVHENCGWHYAAKNTYIAVYEHHGKFSTLMTIDEKHPGVGEVYWSDVGRFDDPNEAVMAQLYAAKAYSARMQKAIEHVEKAINEPNWRERWKQANPNDQCTVILMAVEGLLDNAKNGIGCDKLMQRMELHVNELIALRPYLAKGSWD